MNNGGMLFCILCLIMPFSFSPIGLQSSSNFGDCPQPVMEQSYVTHAPIRIGSDADFVSQGWPGSGSLEDPFVIAGLEIENFSHCIEITDTEAYFCIRDCKLVIRGLAACIHLNRVENGDISQNNITGPSATGFGVWLEECNGTVIHNNFLSQRIALRASTNTRISDNIGRSLGHISLLESNRNTIENNTITDTVHTIILDRSLHNHIVGNFINDSVYGITLQRDSSSNQINSNTVTFCSQTGLHVLPDCTNNAISWNTLAFNTGNAVDGGSGNIFDFNYYSDYTGPDWNLDGIGDTPHPIPGIAGSWDLHPLRAPPGVPAPNSYVEFLIMAIPLFVVVGVLLVCCGVCLVYRWRYR